MLKSVEEKIGEKSYPGNRLGMETRKHLTLISVGAILLYLTPFLLFTTVFLVTNKPYGAWLIISEPFGFYEFIIAPFTLFTIQQIWTNRHYFSKKFIFSITASLTFYVLEEFSYGQHLLSPSIFPDALIPDDNIQGEANFHNIVRDGVEVENVIHHVFFFAMVYMFIFCEHLVIRPILGLALIVERMMNFLILEGVSSYISLDINEVFEGLLSLLILLNFTLLLKFKRQEVKLARTSL